MTRLFRKLTGIYLASWLVLLWSFACVSAGAVAMNVADTQAALAAVHHWAGCNRAEAGG